MWWSIGPTFISLVSRTPVTFVFFMVDPYNPALRPGPVRICNQFLRFLMKSLPSPPLPSHPLTHPPTHPLLKKRLNKRRTNKFIKIFESFVILFSSSSSLNTNGSKFRQEKKWNGRRRKEGLLIEYKVRINLKSKFSIFLTSEVNRPNIELDFYLSPSLFFE